jgi:hypothetical protein
MYRCFECDTPAQMNCGCFTQMEMPQHIHHPTADRLEQEQQKKINIASGEDAIADSYMYHHEECV